MNEIEEGLENINIDENGVDVNVVMEILEKENFSFSNKLLKRITTHYGLFRCNRCNAYFDGWNQLRGHLRKEKHFIDPDELRNRKEALLERVYGIQEDAPEDEQHYLSKNPAEFPLNYEDLTKGEKLTLVQLAIDRAYMIRFKKRR